MDSCCTNSRNHKNCFEKNNKFNRGVNGGDRNDNDQKHIINKTEIENQQLRRISPLTPTPLRHLRQWTSIHDEYRTIEILGQGTYGVVYKAEHKITGEIVALKRCRLDIFKDFGIPETTLREIVLLHDLKHENIMKLYRISCNTERMYMICEYLELDLKKYLRANMANGIPLRKVKEITFAILKGLAFCHGHRIIHRDLKPHNILVSSDACEVKIGDFGLARSSLIPGKTLTHEVITLWYRAPELLLGHCNYTYGVDIWSIGCIIAELLNCRPLFAGDSEIDLLFKIVRMLGSPLKEDWPEHAVIGWEQFPKFKGEGEHLFGQIKGLDSLGRKFLKKILQFNGSKRPSARDLLQDPWLEEVRNNFEKATKNQKDTNKEKKKQNELRMLNYSYSSIHGKETEDDDGAENNAQQNFCTNVVPAKENELNEEKSCCKRVLFLGFEKNLSLKDSENENNKIPINHPMSKKKDLNCIDLKIVPEDINEKVDDVLTTTRASNSSNNALIGTTSLYCSTASVSLIKEFDGIRVGLRSLVGQCNSTMKQLGNNSSEMLLPSDGICNGDHSIEVNQEHVCYDRFKKKSLSSLNYTKFLNSRDHNNDVPMLNLPFWMVSALSCGKTSMSSKYKRNTTTTTSATAHGLSSNHVGNFKGWSPPRFTYKSLSPPSSLHCSLIENYIGWPKNVDVKLSLKRRHRQSLSTMFLSKLCNIKVQFRYGHISSNKFFKYHYKKRKSKTPQKIR